MELQEEESSSNNEILKDTHFVGKSNEKLLNDLVDIEIGTGNSIESLMTLDKIYHHDDITMFVLFGVFILVNAIVGFLAPPSVNYLSRRYQVSYAGSNYIPLYSIGVNNITSRTSFIDVRVRYITTGTRSINKTFLLNTTMTFGGAFSDSSTDISSSKNATFSIPKGQSESNWVTIFSDRSIKYDDLIARVAVIGYDSVFNAFDFEVKLGSQSDSYMQIIIRILYTVVTFIIYRMFSAKMSTFEPKYEQSITIMLLLVTCVLNNPTKIINYFMPNIFITILDDIIIAAYCGFISFFILFVIGHCGNKEKMKPKFIRNKKIIGSLIGIVIFLRNAILDLIQFYKPTYSDSELNEWLIAGALYIMGIGLIVLMQLTYQAKKRIDESENFKFRFYLINAFIYIFIIMSFMKFIPLDSTVMFLVTYGTANAFVMAMAYAHYPFTIQENLMYKNTRSQEMGDDLELMDKNGQLLPNDTALQIDDSSDMDFIGDNETNEESLNEQHPKVPKTEEEEEESSSTKESSETSESDDDYEEEEEEEKKHRKSKKNRKSKRETESESEDEEESD